MTKLQYEIIKNSEHLRKIGLHEDGVPIVNAYLHDDERTVDIFCPYCGCIHSHGVDMTREEMTHRVSHCWSAVKSIGGYWLRKKHEPMPQEIKKASGIWSRLHRLIERRDWIDTGTQYNIDDLINEAAEKYEC